MVTNHHAELVTDYEVEGSLIDFIPPTSEVTDRYIEKFGIDDARELVRLAHNRPVEFEEVTLIVRTSFITHEAQNALLKILEEPPVSTKFVFVLPPDFVLLPTLLSRFNLRSPVKVKSVLKNETFKIFLQEDYKGRLIAIEKSTKSKDTVWQRSIKNGLIEYLTTTKKKMDSLSNLEYVSRTLLTRGASNKMLLEHAALMLKPRL